MDVNNLDPLGVEDDKNHEGITIYLKVNYKVILLMIVVLDVFHVSLSEFVVRVFGP